MGEIPHHKRLLFLGFLKRPLVLLHGFRHIIEMYRQTSQFISGCYRNTPGVIAAGHVVCGIRQILQRLQHLPKGEGRNQDHHQEHGYGNRNIGHDHGTDPSVNIRDIIQTIQIIMTDDLCIHDIETVLVFQLLMIIS